MEKEETIGLLEEVFLYLSQSVVATNDEAQALAEAVAMLKNVPEGAFAEDMANRLFQQGDLCQDFGHKS